MCLSPKAAIIILTGHGSLETALREMHLGVLDYMLKTSVYASQRCHSVFVMCQQ